MKVNELKDRLIGVDRLSKKGNVAGEVKRQRCQGTTSKRTATARESCFERSRREPSSRVAGTPANCSNWRVVRGRGTNHTDTKKPAIAGGFLFPKSINTHSEVGSHHP